MSIEATSSVWARIGPIGDAVLALKGPKSRTDREMLIALLLADRYRDQRGYVDETVEQIAATMNLRVGQVKRPLKALDDAGVWVVVRRGRRRLGGTRREFGPVLLAPTAAHHGRAADEAPTTAHHGRAADSGSTTAQHRSTTAQHRSTAAHHGRAVPRINHVSTPADSAQLALVEPDAAGMEFQPGDDEPFAYSNGDEMPTDEMHNMTELLDHVAATVTETREHNGYGRPTSAMRAKVRAQAGEHRDLVRFWLDLGARPSEAASALAMRVSGQNANAVPRSLVGHPGLDPPNGRRDDGGQFHPRICGCDECTVLRAATIADEIDQVARQSRR